MPEIPVKWKLLDHPADIKIEVFGENLEKLFLNAGLALTFLLVGSIKHTAPKSEKTVTLESGDLDILLVDWLREILFYFDVEKFVLSNAVVTIEKVENYQLLKASLLGFVLPHSDELPDGMEIKGITYHDLFLDKNPDGFVARVIFDV
ncbi:MAG: archease [Deltaproteobacteria bacterium]|nr:archease [Deltaproteobacteria bacterium]